jgi:hypothetical protein
MFVDGEVQEVTGLRERLAGLLERLDPAAMLASDAARVVEELAAVVRLADAGMTLLTARVAEAGTWQHGGHSTSAEWLAGLAGTSRADAAERVRTSQRVQGLPATQRRLRAGRLSARQVREVADGATANPEAEQRLLDTAEAASLGELRDETQRAKAAADPDPDATHARIHQHRRVRARRDAEGAWCLDVRGTVDSGAQIMAALRAEQDRIFRAARTQGRREPEEAYLYDALHHLVTGITIGDTPDDTGDTGDRDTAAGDTTPGGTGERDTGESDTAGAGGPAPPKAAGSDAKIIVRIDYDALVRGQVEGGEVCEIAGLGPVPVSVVRHWADHDAFLAAVITRGTDVATVAHLGRRFTAQQRTALQWANPTCARQGCNRTIRLEYDHRNDWATTLRSLASDADRLCGPDHALKTHHGWALVTGTGTRPLVPPHDPRHPTNQPSAPPGHPAAPEPAPPPARPPQEPGAASDHDPTGQLRLAG